MTIEDKTKFLETSIKSLEGARSKFIMNLDYGKSEIPEIEQTILELKEELKSLRRTMNTEPFKYYSCLFPIRQVSPGRAKWDLDLDEEGQTGALTLVDPGEEDYFYGGYAFIPHPELMDMTKWMPWERRELYIKENSCRARERTTVILFERSELRAFREALQKYTDQLPSEVDEVQKEVLNKVGMTELFEHIFRSTIRLFYRVNSFQYWKQLVNYGFVPYMIGEKLWEGWGQYGGREQDYVSSGGYNGTQEFTYSFYGTDQSRSEDGIRDVGRYLREETGGRLNESRAKEFLSRINPFECGRYVCGVKISDRTTINNGGFGSGHVYKLLYDKVAIYQGMQEKAGGMR